MASNGNKQDGHVNYNKSSGVKSDHVEITIHKPTKRRGSHFLPKPFERSNGSLLNPKFDSEILENFLGKCYFPQTRRMFKKTVHYVAFTSLCWALYFGLFSYFSEESVSQDHENVRYFYIGGAVAFFLIMMVFSLISRTDYFANHPTGTSALLAFILVLSIQFVFIFQETVISPIGSFCAVIEILLLIYSFLPFNLMTALAFGGFLSVTYEVGTFIRFEDMQDPKFVFCKILLHVILHIFGIFIFTTSNTRLRSNFSKIGQSVSAQQDLMVEREIKEKMIHSLMPPSVAKAVMGTHPSPGDEQEEDEDSKKKSRKKRHQRGEIIFRKFQMDEMKNVSILFADIVGFTKMSSGKTAESLVGLLNNLFGRFDKLCTASGCEKISTLGDCYYCVAGCPTPRPDHAKCCVEMGLAMIKAIDAFDEDFNEEVNMRVGVHTGTVLCGIVGTVRFKFDVWSNDVTLANIMESSGEPGKVHISESTKAFCDDLYEMTEGDEVPDLRGRKELIENYDAEQKKFIIQHKEENMNIKTYFINGHKPGISGIPGLMDLADERPSQGEIERMKAHGVTVPVEDQTGNPTNLVNSETVVSNDLTENGSPTAACDLLSQRIPDIMEDEETELQDKDVEVDKQVGSSLLKHHHEHTDEEDRLLISLIEKENKDNEAFFKPSLDRIWLTFDKEKEYEYRHGYRESHLFQENMLSSPRYQATIESCISLFLALILALTSHLIFDPQHPGLKIMTLVGVLINILIFADAFSNIVCLESKIKKFEGLMDVSQNWHFRHMVGVVAACVPCVLVYTAFYCHMPPKLDYFYCFSLLVSLLGFCNFVMLRSFLKSIVAILVSIALIILLFVHICRDSIPSSFMANVTLATTATYMSNSSNITITDEQESEVLKFLFSGEDPLRFEMILAILLLLLLLVILNYEFENSYRLSFNASIKAQKDKTNMQTNKDQADWLLHNIIPAHLSDKFKTNRFYSHNHTDVGVIFATITNFNEFYDEMYAGGREYLRVLNELFSDYEVMLSDPRFKDVEKIKTISSCFMAASGLNEGKRAQNIDKYAHLYALMDFAIELQEVIAAFNSSIFNFDFTLNIGYNYGPITAGVIGTTKLLYDIWGDTVNIASRMYSTGPDNRIQVPEATSKKLEPMFEFSYRDEISVKGKGTMKTYLLERKKPGAHWH